MKIFFLTLIILLNVSKPEANKENVSNRACVNFNYEEWMSNNQSSIVTIETRGRLGNHLMSFSILLALKDKFDIYMIRNTFDYITQTFEIRDIILNIPVLEDTFCSIEKMNFEPYSGSIKDLTENKDLRRGKLLNLWPDVYVKHEKKCCPTSELMEFSLKKIGFNILSILTFKEEFRNQAQEVLRSVEKERKELKIGENCRTKKPILFIGVHDRRKDYIPYIKKNYNLSPLKKSYFSHAMTYFEEEYGQDYDVIFIYVSDDLAWGRQRFKNKENVYFKGNEDEDAPSSDLSLLASCNHSLITRGTFSMWSAILAGGEYYYEYGVIVPSYLQNSKNKKYSH